MDVTTRLQPTGAPTVFKQALRPAARRGSPSWLAQVNQGATTIWESWDGKGPQNHYSLGALTSWMYERLAGLKPTAPGWASATIRPLMDERVPLVYGATMTAFGRISCRSELTEQGWAIQLSVPLACGQSEDVKPVRIDQSPPHCLGATQWVEGDSSARGPTKPWHLGDR